MTDKPKIVHEDLHLDAFRLTMLVTRTKADEVEREAKKDGRFHVHRNVAQIIPNEPVANMPVAGPNDEWISVCTGRPRDDAMTQELGFPT